LKGNPETIKSPKFSLGLKSYLKTPWQFQDPHAS
jgi:hypothetical protein